MGNVSKFLKKLQEETYQVVKEEESKDLAKEDSLSLIAEFVKDVKKQFKKKEDRIEILKSAAKTLDFYIDEIEEGDDDFGSSMGDTSSDFDTNDDSDDDDEDIDIEPEKDTEEGF